MLNLGPVRNAPIRISRPPPSAERAARALSARCSARVLRRLWRHSSTVGPSPSLVDARLHARCQPPPSSPARRHAHGAASTLPASWPIGWDVSFCTAFADLTVAHELVIDIERAIADDNKADAQGLANELAQTAPDCHDRGHQDEGLGARGRAQDRPDQPARPRHAGGDVYQSYFNDDVKSALRQARQVRNQVSKAVAPANEQLQQLAALGLSCPGTDLKLETF